MEIDDKSVTVGGLTNSELEEIGKKYSLVSQEELHSIRDIRGIPSPFEDSVRRLNFQKKKEILYGRCASITTSLFMLLSVHVKPMRKSSSSLFSIYGEITSFSDCFPTKKGYIYKRESQDVETFSDDGGYLTLTGPPCLHYPKDVLLLFQSKELSVRLYDQQGQHLYPLVDDDDYPIILDYSTDDFEQVKEKEVHNTQISLTFKYVSIPMAVYGLLRLGIYKREGYANESKFVNVCGKVVAKYKNTYGDYNSEEFVLFDKKNPEYETLDLCKGYNDLLSSSRSWLAAPAYSLLHLHFDLFDCQEGTKLIHDVQLATEASTYRSHANLLFGEYFIEVSAVWLTPPYGRRELLGSDDQIPRILLPPNSAMEIFWKPAIEIFSVLVFDEGRAPVQIHGRLQFSCGRSVDFDKSGVDIFKQEADDPLTLSGRGDTIPVSTDFKCLDFFCPSLSIICDLEAIKDGLKIKGYQILSEPFDDTELCSFFQGVHGFAALHYAIFSSALRATLKVFVCQRKRKRSQCDVSGSICARYKHFDYSSQYHKNWYTIVLFKGRELMDVDDPLSSSLITLSRSSLIVPSYSSPIIDLDLMIGTQKFSQEIEAEFGRTTRRSFEIGECDVECLLEWSEVE